MNFETLVVVDVVIAINVVVDLDIVTVAVAVIVGIVDFAIIALTAFVVADVVVNTVVVVANAINVVVRGDVVAFVVDALPPLLLMLSMLSMLLLLLLVLNIFTQTFQEVKTGYEFFFVALQQIVDSGECRTIFCLLFYLFNRRRAL